MKAETEIYSRLRGLLVRELDRRMAEAGKRLPHLCIHNRRQALDFRKMVEGEPNPNYNCIDAAEGSPEIGLCFYGSEDLQTWPGNICEEAIDAQRCPLFTPKLSKEGILTQFRQDLAQPGWISENLPAVAELLWVLDLAKTTPIPWWRRLWHKVLRIRVEPVVEAKKVEDLFPS